MNRSFSRLDDHLNAISRTVDPPTDLWPAIAAQARRQRSYSWLMNAAAGVAIAALATLLMRAAYHADRGESPVPRHAIGATTVSFALPDGARYQNARDALESTYQERLKLLRPATRATIEANLQIIRRANDDIRRALESDPASPVLLQLLNETYQQEFDLYQNVARNTEPTQGRG